MSTPTTTEKYVKVNAAKVKAMGCAYFCNNDKIPVKAVSGSAYAFSPRAPLKIPTIVIPTWMVERKEAGLFFNTKVELAPRLPSFVIFRRRESLAEITASQTW